jgi:thioredoxin 1
MIVLDEENFEEKVLKNKKPVLVDFWAPWCGPCQMLTPIIEKLAEEFEGKIVVSKLNVDENQIIASQYEISAIPALYIFKNGKIIEKIIGFHSKKDLSKKINTII